MASPPAIPSAADADLEILDAIATSSVARRSSRALLWGPQDEVIEGIEQDAEESATCESPLTPENYRSYMWNRGWCSHQIEHLLRAYGKDWPCLLKFAELDRRLHRQQDHRPCLSTSHCIAYDSPPDQDYHVQHVTHCPGCDMVQTPQKALAAVVASGGVPLISIQGLDEPNCAVSLRVHRREFRTKYMAVSHVWADGLGNPFNNALPVCQIKRLHGLVMYMKNNKWATGRKTSMQICDDWLFGTWKSELLWIDTLCVPVGRDQEDLRSQCIDAMSSIYAESSTVVVLDAELMQSPMPLERDDLTPLYRIASSVWACRSWTLQEGTLPPDIFFRFKDGCFNPGKRLCHYATWTRLGKVIKPLDAAEVHSRLWSEQWAIVPTLYEGCFSRDILIWYRANDFASTWNGLSGRSTTRPSDLYIVLASCLGFRLRQFQHITTTEAKMQRIIFSYPELPLSLFYNHGPKMHSNEDHHNRWVPSQISNHLLTCGGSFDFPKPWISVYSDQGTLLKLNLVNETVLLVAEPLSMPLASAVSDGTTTYRIDVQVSELDQFQASKYAGTCFVLSEDTNFSDGSQEGACFYISDQVQDPETGEQLSIVMVYFAPLKATRLEPSPESALSPATIHADRVSIRDLWVKFAPLPNRKVLRRQTTRRQFTSYWAVFSVILATYPLLLGSFVMVVKWHDGNPLQLLVDATFEATAAITEEIKGRVLTQWLILGVLLCLTIALLSPLCAIPVYLISRLSDYIWLYQSYDDNTVAQRFGRLLKAARFTFVITVSDWIARLRNALTGKRRSARTIALEDMEIQ